MHVCTDAIIADERLRALPRVRITAENTLFWRPQKKKPPTHLATIEAIYYFFKQYATAFECQPYDGRYDNLLFWFVFYYKMIQSKKNEGAALENAPVNAPLAEVGAPTNSQAATS